MSQPTLDVSPLSCPRPGRPPEDRLDAEDRANHPEMPPSVNFHLWEPCNMRCRFCFATFQDVRAEVLPKGHLPREEALRLVEVLAAHFEKLTFAGGEPLLCPWLPELVHAAKARGATTMLVTNGSRLSHDMVARFQGNLDWVTLSIDSASPETNKQSGRAIQGRKAITAEEYLAMGARVREAGMRLKVNTVVTSLNALEDMTEWVRGLRPERWKILRVLPVEGQNSGSVEPLLCSAELFQSFVDRHRGLNAEGIALVPEDNTDMRGSYAMVDPAGRFFDNSRGGHSYTQPILSGGIHAAWSQAHFSMERFDKRGGRYDFGGGR